MYAIRSYYDYEGALTRTPPEDQESKSEEKRSGKAAKPAPLTSPQDWDAERNRQLAELKVAETKKQVAA